MSKMEKIVLAKIGISQTLWNDSSSYRDKEMLGHVLDETFSIINHQLSLFRSSQLHMVLDARFAPYNQNHLDLQNVYTAIAKDSAIWIPLGYQLLVKNYKKPNIHRMYPILEKDDSVILFFSSSNSLRSQTIDSYLKAKKRVFVIAFSITDCVLNGLSLLQIKEQK